MKGNQPFRQNLDLAVNTTEMLLKSTTYPSVTATLTLICMRWRVSLDIQPSFRRQAKLQTMHQGYWQNSCRATGKATGGFTGKATGGLLAKPL